MCVYVHDAHKDKRMGVYRCMWVCTRRQKRRVCTCVPVSPPGSSIFGPGGSHVRAFTPCWSLEGTWGARSSARGFKHVVFFRVCTARDLKSLVFDEVCAAGDLYYLAFDGVSAAGDLAGVVDTWRPAWRSRHSEHIVDIPALTALAFGHSLVPSRAKGIREGGSSTHLGLTLYSSTPLGLISNATLVQACSCFVG